jgi:uncharacterized cofD-like protein
MREIKIELRPNFYGQGAIFEPSVLHLYAAMWYNLRGEKFMLQKLKTATRWLAPGMGIKRWLVVLFIGITILALGFGLFLRDLYSATGYPPLVRLLALQFWPRWLRALFFGSIGVGLIGLSLYRFNQTMLQAILPREPGAAELAEILHRARRRRKGPKVVTIGGGTGMSNLLRGLKKYTDNITAIVTVADDGGSSGRLRQTLRVLPPGDFRNCIAALADDDALTTQLFQYRFSKRGNGNGLEGHSFGNLFITAMAAVTGSFERALAESSHVLAIRGRIFPSTLQDVTLYADVAGEKGSTRVRGESAIPHSPYPIERVYLDPDNPPAYPGAIRAILEADFIILGPGSLFTSLLPNLLVPEIAQAIRATQAPKIFVCNVATQRGETENFTLADHIRTLETHIGPDFFAYVLANNNLRYSLPSSWGLNLVNPEFPDKMRYRLIQGDVIDAAKPWRHNPDKLAELLLHWYQTEAQKVVNFS